jgi:hypothetical protein
MKQRNHASVIEGELGMAKRETVDMPKHNRTEFGLGQVGSLAACLLMSLSMACGSDEPNPGATVQSQAQAPVAEVANHAPEIRRVTISPRNPISGGTVTATVDATDKDGDPITLTYEWSAGGNRLSGPSNSVTLNRVRKDDEIRLTVTASDGKEQTKHVERETVKNAPPVVDGVQMAASMSGMLTATPVGHDRDEDSITYTYRWLVNGKAVHHSGSSLELAKYRTGDIVTVEVTADDGDEESAAKESGAYELRNNKPAIVSRPDAMAIVGENTILYEVKAEDPNRGQRLQYRLEEGPEGMEIDMVSGELTWTPKAGQEGEFPVRILVDDMNGGTATQSFSVSAAVETEEVAEAGQ